MGPLPTATLRQLICAAIIMMTSLPASALESETCFSRQHRGATVTLQVTLNRTAAPMDARLVHSERDCVLACCSEEVRPGARCNMVLFNGKKPIGEENCFLFHCDGEQDCPLMKAADGINTYNIYKGLIHPPTPRPVTMTTSRFLLTTVLLPTTTLTPTTTTQAPVTSPAPSTVITTHPTLTAPPTTTTTSTAKSPAPTLTSKRPNKTSKKPSKSTKKGKSHSISTQPPSSFTTQLPVQTGVKEGGAQRTTETPRLQAGTTASSTAATTAATTTTNAPPTTTNTPTPTTTVITSTVESTTTRVTLAEGLIIVPKETIQAHHVLQNSGPAHGKVTVAHGALKSSMVAFMIVALAVLTLALVVGGRKAMESFDRRHYTRLELNDLHYEV